MIRKCLICGKEFEYPRGNYKFCSPECREKGSRKAREAWEKRTDYTKNQRLKRRVDYEKKAEARIEERRKFLDELDQFHEAIRNRDELIEERAEAGELYAICTDDLEYIDENSVKFWKEYAKYHIALDESFGYRSARTVNGISIYDFNFPKRVIRSILCEGRCYQQTNGLGEKLK